MSDSIRERDLARVSPAPTSLIRALQNGKSVLVPLPEVTNAAALVEDAIDAIESAGKGAMALAVGRVESEADLAIAAVEYGADSAIAAMEDGVERAIQRAGVESEAVLAGLGYLSPVEFEEGLDVDSARFTVSYDGSVYAPVSSEVPFTTTDTFDPDQWRLVQGVSGADLASAAGAAMVGFEQLGDSPSVRPLYSKLLELAVSPEDFGAVADGAADDTTPLSNAIAAGRRVLVSRGKRIKISSAISCPSGTEIYLEEGAEIIGAGSHVFISGVDSGQVKIIGKGKVSGVTKLVDFQAGADVDLVQIHGVEFTGTTNNSAAAAGALISYFSSNVHVKTIDVQDCIVNNGREGVLFRGTWDTARVVNNKIIGAQHYSIRLGQDRDAEDWDLQGYALVSGNDIRNIKNPISGSGSNECNGISVFSKSANIFGNFIENVDGGGVDDIEGIYTKVQHGNIYGNVLVDACRREGAIVVKTAPRKPETDYDQVNTINVYGNVVWFELSRSHEAGISIQSSNVNCYGNFIYAGAAITAESAGIVVKYRSPYRNISIHDNYVYTPAFGYGILAWAYGENVTIKDNHVWGCGEYGIRLETRSSSDTRYPSSDPIGKNYVVEGNQINSEAIGDRSGMARGLSISINSAATVTGLMIRNNTFTGPFTEYRVALSGSGSANWSFEGNDIGGATGAGLLLGTLPTGFYVRANPGLVTRAKGTSSVGAGSATQTVSTGISSLLGSYLTTADVMITPLSANFYDRKVFVDTVFSSGNFRVDTASSSGNAAFRWEVSLEDRSLS